MPPKFNTRTTLIVAAGAMLLGILPFTSIPKYLGFYRLIVYFFPRTTGLFPSFHHGITWNYTHKELYSKPSQKRVAGQRAIVTGANSGMGYEMSLALARLGVHVTMACRNATECQDAAKRITANASSWSPHPLQFSVTTMVIDTSSLSSVQAFAKEYLKLHPGKPLDMLFLNAGIFYLDYRQRNVPLSEDGIELIFATNYLGHHLLYRLLEPALHKSTLARVVWTSSFLSYYTYPHHVATDLETLNEFTKPRRWWIPPLLRSYGQSKLAALLWVKKLTRMTTQHHDDSNKPARFSWIRKLIRAADDEKQSQIYANTFNPGGVGTPLYHKSVDDMRANRWPVSWILDWLDANVLWRPADGALTGLFLGVAVDRLVRDNVRGQFFSPQAHPMVNPMSLNETLQDALWNFSEQLIQEYLHVPDEEPGHLIQPMNEGGWVNEAEVGYDAGIGHQSEVGNQAEVGHQAEERNQAEEGYPDEVEKHVEHELYGDWNPQAEAVQNAEYIAQI